MLASLQEKYFLFEKMDGIFIVWMFRFCRFRCIHDLKKIHTLQATYVKAIVNRQNTKKTYEKNISKLHLRGKYHFSFQERHISKINRPKSDLQILNSLIFDFNKIEFWNMTIFMDFIWNCGQNFGEAVNCCYASICILR